MAGRSGQIRLPAAIGTCNLCEGETVGEVIEILGIIFVWCLVLGVAGYAADQLRSVIKGDWDQ